MYLQTPKNVNLDNKDYIFIRIVEESVCSDIEETHNTISISDKSHMKLFLRKLLCLIHWNPFMSLLGEVSADPFTNGLRQDISAAMLWNEDEDESTVDQRNKNM